MSGDPGAGFGDVDPADGRGGAAGRRGPDGLDITAIPPRPSDQADPAEPEAAAGGATDPARGLLDRLRRGSPAPIRRTGSRQRGRNRSVLHPDEQVWSGARPGERDPLRLAATVDGLVTDQGWRRTLDEASLAPRWAAIVGHAVAQHCRPESLAGGVLTIRAESTAWATQLRLMSRGLIARITAEAGEGIVTKVQVLGPAGPDWRHGPLRVRGRGPRDTYG